jgi:hypothetical protein
MRRALLISLLAAAGLCPTAAAGVASARGPSVKLLECRTALAQEDRSATFEARVRATSGSDRMQVRFTLQVREGAAMSWRRVTADGLDEWLSSAPLVTRYTYAKTVENLVAPATYRMVARFRWVDASGDVIARARAASRRCRQPDLRPDLRVTRITVLPAADGGSTRYEVAVRNSGRSAAGPFAVGLSAAAAFAPVRVPGLAPGELRAVAFSGPPCTAGAELVATADADAAVDERDELDNALAVACSP